MEWVTGTEPECRISDPSLLPIVGVYIRLRVGGHRASASGCRSLPLAVSSISGRGIPLVMIPNGLIRVPRAGGSLERTPDRGAMLGLQGAVSPRRPTPRNPAPARA